MSNTQNNEEILEAETGYVYDETAKVPAWVVAVRITLIIVMLGGAILVARHWITNKVKPTRKPHGSVATTVDLLEMHKQDYRVKISAMGEVVPAKQVSLTSQVSGKIVELADENFAVGSIFESGQMLLKIEQIDYQIALNTARTKLLQEKANLLVAQAAYDQELGKQKVARKEYELMGEKLSETQAALLLRKPQLKTVEAKLQLANNAVELAQLQLEQAGLDMARTEITAPFNCVITDTFVDITSLASTGAPLAEIVDTDSFWVELSVPVNDLKWISVPSQNSTEASAVRLTMGPQGENSQWRDGQVTRLSATLDSEGRTAIVIAEVKDPLALKDPTAFRLLLGSYVRAEILGKKLTDAYRLPRSAVLEGGEVLIYTPEKRLELRRLRPAWSDDEYFYFSDGLSDGEKCIVSTVAAPVEGMLLQDSSLPKPQANNDAADGTDERNASEDNRGGNNNE